MGGFIPSFVTTRREAAIATLAGNSITVFIVSFQALLLIPLYLDAVGARVSGAWLASAEILLWMQAMDLGIPNLMIQRIAAAHGRGDRRSGAGWFASGQLLLALVSTAVAGAGVLISFSLPPLFGLADSEADVLRGCFLLGTIASCATIFSNGFVGLARAVQDTTFISGVLIVSAIVGLVTSLTLILMGWGLWAVAIGLAARAAMSLTASVAFGIFAWRREFGVPFGIERAVVGQLLKASPATAIGGVSYAFMSQSEIILVASLARPELAVVYALTRKAADLGRSLVDMIGFATYGGFAHLIGGPQRDQAQAVRSQILSLHLSAAIAVAAAYLAVNRSLVSTWVGADFFGGLPLVFLMALQSVVLGHSYLINLFYRATGRVVEGSLALAAEAVVRLPLLAALLQLFGLPGLPAAAILTAATSAVLIHRLSMRELGSAAEPRPSPPSIVTLGRLGLLAIGGALAAVLFVPNWLYVVLVGGMVAVLGAAMLVLIDPILRKEFLSWARRPSPVHTSSQHES